MTPEQLKLINQACDALKKLEELTGENKVQEKDCMNCKNYRFGICEILGAIFCDGKLPRHFYCNQYQRKE